jgi:DNA replication protein DnaC
LPQQQSRPGSSTADEIERYQKALEDPSEDVLQKRGVPKKYMKARISDFGDLPLQPPNDDGLFLTGATGTGKTHLATAWLVRRLPSSLYVDDHGKIQAHGLWWDTAPEILGELRGTFGDRGAGSEQSVIWRLGGMELLVIDDLGAEQTTDWTGQALYRLICRRINECRPTIVTSNLSLEELDRRDPRLASRLGGMAYQRLEGADRRMGCRTHSKP